MQVTQDCAKDRSQSSGKWYAVLTRKVPAFWNMGMGDVIVCGFCCGEPVFVLLSRKDRELAGPMTVSSWTVTG